MSENDHILIVALIILTLVGFTLLLSYIKSAVFITIFHLLFIFAYSFQLFFMARGAWDILGIS